MCEQVQGETLVASQAHVCPRGVERNCCHCGVTTSRNTLQLCSLARLALPLPPWTHPRPPWQQRP